MSIHTGMLPHSTERVATGFTGIKFDSFPALLRKQGYTAHFFTGTDPDWDNQRFWAEKWYDSIYFDPKNKEKDRLVFRKASEDIKALGQTGKPFLASVFSISNHAPFNTPEEKFLFTKSSDLKEKITNTMSYTDNVVQELYDSLKNEEWFKDTIFIVTGDHGYDLGDRGVSGGHTNLRHESTWVPLIIHGSFDFIKGKNETVGSHTDLAPTILDLAGICDETSFLGHSLFAKKADKSYAITVKESNFSFETPFYSAFFPKNSNPMLFKSEDILQIEDTSTKNLKTIEEYREKAEIIILLNDTLIESNKIK